MTTGKRPDQIVNILRESFINCWIPIAQTTLAAPAASVTFSSIPQTFRMIVLFTSLRTDSATTGEAILWRANGDANANYDRVYHGVVNAAFSAGNNIGSTSGYLAEAEGNNSRANSFAPGFTFFFNYNSTTQEKYSLSPISTAFGTPAAATVVSYNFASRWKISPIAAITSITVLPSAGPNLVAGSAAYLYGIL